MSDNRKKFRVRCPHCERSFNVRFGPQDAKADAGGKAVVVVDCLHCGKSSAVEIPREFVPDEVMIRGVATELRPAERRLGDDEAAPSG